MKYLVIGTGTIGGPLINILASRGDDVYVVCRHKRNMDMANVHFVYGNIKDSEFLISILNSKYDGIIDTAWYSSKEFESTFIQKLKSCNHYIALSSAGVYADNLNPIPEESPRFLDKTPPNPSNYYEYHYEKARIENALKSSGYNNWTIIRPHITYSENHLPYGEWSEEEWLKRVMIGKPIVVPKDMLPHKTNYSSGKDVAKMIVAILNNETAKREIYNVSSSEILTWGDLLTIFTEIIRKTGLEVKTHLIPNSDILEKAYPFMKYRYICDRLLDRSFDITKIENVIGGIPTFVSTKDELERCVVSWMSRHKNALIKLSGRSYGIQDRICGTWTKLNNFDHTKQKISYLYFRILPICISISIENFIRKTIVKK